MITEHFKIVAALSGIDIELTINQISKNLGFSYASTNKYVHELMDMGVVKSRTIGPSILCSLDYRENLTLSALVFNSLSESGIGDMKGDIIYSYDNKNHILGEGNRHKLLTLDFKKLKVLKGHEGFWKIVGELSR
jgi:hypothetical protein